MIINNKIKVLEGIEPSNDLDMHLEIYKERKDIRTIMHVHPLYTATFAVVNKVIASMSKIFFKSTNLLLKNYKILFFFDNYYQYP